MQARYFRDRLVVGVGFRGDTLRTLTRGTTRDARGLIVTDYENNTFASYAGRTKTLGAVYHVTPRVSVFYNQSDNFGLPPSILLVPDGRRARNPEGRGTDYGIAVTLLEGKLYARVNAYETQLVNGANSNYGGSSTAPDAVGDTILNALVAESVIGAAEADQHRVVNTGATYAQLVRGVEFNLTANPTANWRLQANFSFTRGYTTEVAPEVQAWAAEQLPYFRRFDQDIATAAGTIRQVLATWEDYHRSQLDLVGLTLSGNREYKVNVYTSYSFNAGRLRGLRVGGGYRHQSKLPIGQYADRSLQFGPSWWEASAMVGYRFSKIPVPGLGRLELQLNVNNLFDDEDPYVLRRVQGTSPEVVRRVRVREPRTWRLATSFDF
jgi:outer membrane receptor for ferric coprogen and ferric-rhodotorulic acid